MTNLVEEKHEVLQADIHASLLEDYLAEQGLSDTSGLELLRLVRMASHAYDTILNEQMRDSHLSGPRWRLLLHLRLAEKRGVPSVNPTQLSKFQHVSKNTISAHLRALEEQELIERELDPNDRRQFRIRLSDHGRKLIDESTPTHMIFLNELVSELSVSERAELADLLSRLLGSMRENTQCESLQSR